MLRLTRQKLVKFLRFCVGASVEEELKNWKRSKILKRKKILKDEIFEAWNATRIIFWILFLQLFCDLQISGNLRGKVAPRHTHEIS